jgi:hypothetical protein
METLGCTECGYPTLYSGVEKGDTEKFLTASSKDALQVAKKFSRSVKAKATPLERALNGYYKRLSRRKITELRRKGLLRMFAGGKLTKLGIQKALPREEEDEYIDIVLRYGDAARDDEARKTAKDLGEDESAIFPLIWPQSYYANKRRLIGESIRNLDAKADQAIRDILAFSTQETVRPSVSELARRMSAELTGVSGILSPAEAKRTANTEIPSFKNFGKYEVYKKAGVSRVRWVSVIDDRTRPAREKTPRANHIVMDGRETSLGIPFDMAVSGAKMFYPGDPVGPPYEVINCRCTLMPIRQR